MKIDTCKQNSKKNTSFRVQTATWRQPKHKAWPLSHNNHANIIITIIGGGGGGETLHWIDKHKQTNQTHALIFLFLGLCKKWHFMEGNLQESSNSGLHAPNLPPLDKIRYSYTGVFLFEEIFSLDIIRYNSKNRVCTLSTQVTSCLYLLGYSECHLVVIYKVHLI